MNIIPFDFNDNAVRVVEQDNEFYFVAKDICDCLALTNTTVAIEGLDEDELTKLNLGSRSGETWCVTEAGLYQLIFKSRKEEAKPFKRWVTHEVLPTIRRTGSYDKGFFTEQEEEEIADAEIKKYYDSFGVEIPPPEQHRYKLPDTLTPSWVKTVVDLYGKRVAGNYFAQHLGVPQEALSLPKVEFVAVEPEITNFVRECLDKDKREFVTADAVYQAYLAWGGVKSRNNFGKELKIAIGIESRVMNMGGVSTRIYNGLTLRTDTVVVD